MSILNTHTRYSYLRIFNSCMKIIKIFIPIISSLDYEYNIVPIAFKTIAYKYSQLIYGKF